MLSADNLANSLDPDLSEIRSNETLGPIWILTLKLWAKSGSLDTRIIHNPVRILFLKMILKKSEDKNVCKISQHCRLNETGVAVKMKFLKWRIQRGFRGFT